MLSDGWWVGWSVDSGSILLLTHIIPKSIFGDLMDVECLGIRKTRRHTTVVLHKARIKDDFGTTVYRVTQG